jgi:DNA-binding MarR family transcriptional regulator
MDHTPSSSSESSQTSGPMLGALLRVPWEALRQRLQEQLAARGHPRIGLRHLWVFQYPGPDGERPSVLAERARISRQAINKLVNELEAAGYLTRELDPVDGRATLVYLTRSGRQVIRDIRLIIASIEEEWERALGAPSYRQMRSALVELGHLVESEN